VYGPSSLHHHLHQYLGGNESFKTPTSRYHPHYSHQYGSNHHHHHHHHHHHPAPSYTETFFNYSRLQSTSALDSKTQEPLPRDTSYSQETLTESTGRERDTAASIPYEGVQRTQLPATPATAAAAASAQPSILVDGAASSKIEQAYTCLGVGSCVC
jgi:hypothetical protein